MPVLYVDLDPDEEALVLATLDPIGAMAEQSTERFEALLAEITVDDAGLAALLRSLVPHVPKAGLTDPDDVPPLGEESNIKPGDLFALGDHRLLCGTPPRPGSGAAHGGSAGGLHLDRPAVRRRLRRQDQGRADDRERRLGR